MIPDKDTNMLFLADTLPQKYPAFYQRFEKILKDCKVDFEPIPSTKDVWAVDYMPVQVDNLRYIRFVYNPDYLQETEALRNTIPNMDALCLNVYISPEKSDIVLDGGNVISWTDKVIMTDKVFTENPKFERQQLILQLKNLFKVDQLIIIPKDPNDFTGHADGMVRFLDYKTVLVNKYSNQEAEFERAFYKSLKDAELEYIEIPYSPHKTSYTSAKGIYMNYLQMEDLIVLPTFGIKQDDDAVKLFENIFKGVAIRTVNSNEIAKDGGVLNCISWNVTKDNKDNPFFENFDLLDLPWEGTNWHNNVGDFSDYGIDIEAPI